jgi:hypothetical protein
MFVSYEAAVQGISCENTRTPTPARGTGRARQPAVDSAASSRPRTPREDGAMISSAYRGKSTRRLLS